jgi:arabinosaccharide transport system permease protein
MMASQTAAGALKHRSAFVRFWADQRKWTPYLFVAPFFITFFIFTGWPLVRAVTMGFQEMAGFGGQFEPVGLENFKEALFDDPHVRVALKNFFLYVIGSLVTQMPTAFALALLLTSRNLKAKGFFRTLFFIPTVIPGVTMGVIGSWLFNQSRGFINQLYLAVGGAERIAWGALPRHIIPMLLLIAFWRYMGFHAVYLIAGITGIETSIIEAAIVDGASGWQLARHITLPLLRPVFAYITITAAGGSLLMFEVPFIMFDGGGGPGGQAWFFIPYISRMAFNNFRFGYATAIGWLVFFLSIALTLIQLRFFGYGEAK